MAKKHPTKKATARRKPGKKVRARDDNGYCDHYDDQCDETFLDEPTPQELDEISESELDLDPHS